MLAVAAAALVASAAALVLLATTPAGATTSTTPTSTNVVDPVTRTPSPAHTTITASSVRAGQTAHVLGTGFLAGETVDATFHSTPLALGHFTANSSGDVRFTFTIPAQQRSGSHSVVLVGESSTRSLTIRLEVLVAESPGLGPASPTSPALSNTGSAASNELDLAIALLAGGLLLLVAAVARRDHLRTFMRGRH